MLNKQDKKYLFETFATKDQLTQQALDIGYEFDRVREEAQVFKNEVNARFDRLEDLIGDVLLELRSNNRQLEVVSGRVNDHELRISQLEAFA
jgi:hypothetical protein